MVHVEAGLFGDVGRTVKKAGGHVSRAAKKARGHVSRAAKKAGGHVSGAGKAGLKQVRVQASGAVRQLQANLKQVGRDVEKAGKRLETDVNREIRNAKKLNLGAELRKASEQLRKDAVKAAKDLGKQLEKDAKRLASEAVQEKLKSALMNAVPALKAAKAGAIVAGMAKAHKHVQLFEQHIKKLQAGTKKKGVAFVDFIVSEAVGHVAGMRAALKAATSVFIKGAVAELANCKSIAKKVADGGDKLLGVLQRALEKIKSTVGNMKRSVDDAKKKAGKYSKIKLGVDDIVKAVQANAQRAVTDVLKKGLSEIATDFVTDIIIAAAL